MARRDYFFFVAYAILDARPRAVPGSVVEAHLVVAESSNEETESNWRVQGLEDRPSPQVACFLFQAHVSTGAACFFHA